MKLHISCKFSTVVSLVFVFLMLVALVFLTWWLPEIVTSIIDAEDHIGNRSDITNTERAWVLADAYAMVAIAFVAVGLMFFLLRAVLRGAVFTKTAVHLLAAVSWCAFAEGVLFLPLGVWFQLAFAAAVAAFFIGLCLRVVKNVIEEATRIKAENDFTI